MEASCQEMVVVADGDAENDERLAESEASSVHPSIWLHYISWRRNKPNAPLFSLASLSLLLLGPRRIYKRLQFTGASSSLVSGVGGHWRRGPPPWCSAGTGEASNAQSVSPSENRSEVASSIASVCTQPAVTRDRPASADINLLTHNREQSCRYIGPVCYKFQHRLIVAACDVSEANEVHVEWNSKY
jgi:hypothetical protein